MKTVKLPSGAELQVNPAPFAIAKELFKNFAAELKTVRADAKLEIDTNFIKDIICTMISSEKIEASFNECAKRCLYKGQKIDAETFESIEARQDYLTVVQHVCWENIAPFTNGLSVRFDQVLGTLEQLRT